MSMDFGLYFLVLSLKRSRFVLHNNKIKDPFDKPTHDHLQHSRTFCCKMQTSWKSLPPFVPAALIYLLQLFLLSTRLSVGVGRDCGHFGTPAFWPSGRCLVPSSCCFISCGFFHIRSRKKEVTNTHRGACVPKIRPSQTERSPADEVECRTRLLKSPEQVLCLGLGRSLSLYLFSIHTPSTGTLIEN